MTETQRIATDQQGLPLHGERVTVRRPLSNDAANVFRWERDDEVWRYDPHRPYSNTMAEFVPLFERNYVHSNGRQFWFIIEDEQHVPIGTITYFNIDRRLGQVEVGLGLGEKSRWGKGYGAEGHPCVSSLPLHRPEPHAHLCRDSNGESSGPQCLYKI